MSTNNNKKGLDVELHPSLLSDNLKIVKTLYSRDTNPYLADAPTRGRRRMMMDEESGSKRRRLRKEEPTNGKLFEVDKQEMQPWDEKFYKNDEYEIKEKYLQDYSTMKIDDDSEDEAEDEEDLPSVRFIQHPRLMDVERVHVEDEPVSKDEILIGSQEYLQLPKSERLKLRRKHRRKQRMEKYRKVATGEYSKSVLNNDKLSVKKIQNVLMNDKTIEDPTKFELEVKKKAEERKKAHDLENQRRKEESLKKRQEQMAPESSMIECRVFEIHNLSNPKIRFQINTMAKQMKLYGCCVRLRTDISKGKGIIVLLTSKKNSLNKFENKMNKYKEVYDDDMKNFQIETKWTSSLNTDTNKQVGNIVNKKIWFMREFKDEMELRGELQKLGLLKFWSL